MHSIIKPLFYIVLVSTIIDNRNQIKIDISKIQLTDKNATVETKRLYRNMAYLMQSKYVMLGHQNTDLLGYDGEKNENWREIPYRSDVKTATGSYAAVAGYDIFIVMLGQSPEKKNYLRELIKKEYERGQVITFSWHQPNPISKKSCYDIKKGAVRSILPGNENYLSFKEDLSEISDFIKSLKTSDGIQIPVIIRPFHELSGDWFWWGASHCSPTEIKEAYRTIVQIIRDTFQVHQVIWAFSPDRTRSEKEYLKRYPGDDFVDIIGLDYYWGYNPKDDILALKNIQLISSIANKKNKVAAWTEFGNKKTKETGWWQDRLFNITMQGENIQIAYMLTWANWDEGGFIPYLNHPCLQEFREFCNNDEILLNSEMNNIYKNSFYTVDNILRK